MLTSTNPATGEVIAEVPELTGGEIEDRLVRGTEAYRAWRIAPVCERAALLARIADAYEANKDRLALTATREMGKTLSSSIAEVEKCVAAFRFYAERGPAMLNGETVPLASGGTADLVWRPLGPVLAVMPWNFPYWQAVRFLAPTILAGNVGLLKHASIVQGCAQLMEAMVGEAGGPPGLFQNLSIRSGAVNAIIADDRVAAVTLTGSEGAGAAVAAQAGQHLKPVVLELGGSDPFMVLPSADLDAAVSAAVKARTQNTGQSCICAKRLIVHADIYDAFAERFTAAMLAVRAGDPLDAQSDMGPLSSAEQRETVLDQLRAATAQGATLTGGGALDGPGAYIGAGVLTEVAPDSPAARDELFGPVATLFRAADLGAAIRLANDTPFGLGSSIWTREPAEEARLVRDLDAGMIAVNQMLASTPEAPFGGIKRSGHGRELGAFGLHAFMNLTSVLRAGAPAASGGVE